jgi:methanethiol S-methyltransferase
MDHTDTGFLYLILAWFLFGMIHSVLASGRFKQWAMQGLKKQYRFYRMGYSLLATVSLWLVFTIHFACPVILLWMPLPIETYFAITIGMVGFCIMAICIKKYFRDLSGIDALLGKNQTWELQTHGLHGMVRHPLYTGTLLFVWAIFLYAPYLANAISTLCLTLYTLIGIYFEEKKLQIEYGEAYRNYRQKVSMLFPFRK